MENLLPKNFHNREENSDRMPPRRGSRKNMSGPKDYIEWRMDREDENPYSLAKKSGMNPSTLHRILNEPDIETKRSTLEPLCKHWGVTADKIYAGRPTRKAEDPNPLEDLDEKQVEEWVLEHYSSSRLKDLAMKMLMKAARSELENPPK